MPSGPPPEWWRTGSGPGGPPPPIPVDIRVSVTVDQGGWPSGPDPEPGPRWWQRIRWGYNLALAALSFPLAGPWASLLASVRDEASLAGAWVMAVIPLIVLAVLDNARRVEARNADPDLWAPKWRAALARLLLWAAVIGPALTLPITTLVYALTGVKPA
ncbi:hypothetical protein [Streptomyces griseosporeus]|uniref:hypothetical protein n=1 Tax=Streptomyces griseosporeus TaxID=1910 RepID=UPI0036FE9E97